MLLSSVGGTESVVLLPNNSSGLAVTYLGERKLSLFEVGDLRLFTSILIYKKCRRLGNVLCS